MLEYNIKPEIQLIRKMQGCRLTISRFCEGGNKTPGSAKAGKLLDPLIRQ
jgi:hypothetical protein